MFAIKYEKLLFISFVSKSFQIVVLIGWATATAIALLVLYGLYDPDSKTGFADLSTNMAAFYNATNRSAWGLAVCWVIVACATGNGGNGKHNYVIAPITVLLPL